VPAPARRLRPSQAAETSTVVFVWPSDSDGETAATLSSVLKTVPAGTRVMMPRLLKHEGVMMLACTPDAGFGRTLNEAALASGAADLAIVGEACELPEGWMARLRAAAWADDTIAAACTLAAGLGDPMFPGFDGDPVLQSPHTSGRAPQALNPRIFILQPHCAWIRRSTIELLGPFDDSLTHPAAALAEYSARALGRGLSCALADDVCVQRLAGGSPPCPRDQMQVVGRLHPWIEAARQEEMALELGPLRRSLVAARVAGKRLSVTIDARALGSAASGTQTYVAGLVLALARSQRVAVRAVVREAASPQLVSQFEQAGTEVLTTDDALTRRRRSDIAHRPQQVFVPEDLGLLRQLGERVVISHLDLIAYRNPTYHPSPEDWRRYRRTTRLALSAADMVLFFSEHARRDAVAEDLVEPVWTALAGVGVEPGAAVAPLRRPAAVPAGQDLLVMIGADYLHKNRVFALELVDQLHHRHGWEGLLVLAGEHVPHGSSARAEAELLRARPRLAAHVLDLGRVAEDEKRWLLAYGQAVLAPSTYEGFGLVPLEAAAAGIPCLYAATTSLGEVVGSEVATIVPWDAAASADRAFPLLRPGEPRERYVASLSAALSRCRWEPIVERLCEVYRAAIAAPYRTSAPRAWEELDREQLIVDLHQGYVDLQERVDHGLPLIDRGGLLTRQQQRGMMRVASRRWLRGPLLGPFGLLGGLHPDHQRPVVPQPDSASAARDDARDDDSAASSP
jgi:glycosyltransferase involved in cell wall biosynthesis